MFDRTMLLLFLLHISPGSGGEPSTSTVRSIQSFGTEKLHDNLQLHWNVTERIELRLQTENTGYISIGINDNYNMKLAEIIVLSVVEGSDPSEVLLYEYVGSKFGDRRPTMKPNADWTLDSSKVENGLIKDALISRKTETTCETCKNITDEFYFIWALGGHLPQSQDHLEYHSWRGHTQKLKIAFEEKTTPSTTSSTTSTTTSATTSATTSTTTSTMTSSTASLTSSSTLIPSTTLASTKTIENVSAPTSSSYILFGAALLINFC
jgi:hypothetical protein